MQGDPRGYTDAEFTVVSDPNVLPAPKRTLFDKFCGALEWWADLYDRPPRHADGRLLTRREVAAADAWRDKHPVQFYFNLSRGYIIAFLFFAAAWGGFHAYKAWDARQMQREIMARHPDALFIPPVPSR